MKIGIIVYSQTENSYSVAKKLEEKFKGDGHDATVARVTTVGKSSPGSGKIELSNLPPVDVRARRCLAPFPG